MQRATTWILPPPTTTQHTHITSPTKPDNKSQHAHNHMMERFITKHNPTKPPQTYIKYNWKQLLSWPETHTNNITKHNTRNHLNHIHILCGDFNRDIAIIGHQNEYITTPPQAEDIKWSTFMNNLQLTYIPTNSSYSRQGGQIYNQTSLIDWYYIKTPNNALYTSTTNNDHNLNSDHSPVILHIPPNTLLAHCMPPITDKSPKILNPIPQANIEKFKIEFFVENAL